MAAIATVILTVYLFRENRLLRRANTEPEVVAYLSPDNRTGYCLHLVIENIGQGTARNVRFVIHADMSDFEAHDVTLEVLEDRKPFSILKRDAILSYFLGTFPKIFEEPGLKPFEVSVEYENLKGERREQKYPLDAYLFYGTDVSTPPEVEIARSLEKIERTLSHFSSGFKRLKVETITTDEVRKDGEQARKLQRKQSDSATAEPDTTQST